MKKHGVRVGDAAVKAKTGKTWAQWFQILDKAGAKKLNHTQIASLLYFKFKVPGWWCQMVAVAYEQSRGLRMLHQQGETFAATLGRTFACSAAKLFSACKDAKKRRAWMKNDKFAISSTQLNKTLRGAWDGESRLVIGLIPKGGAKTQLAIDHMKLTSHKDVEKMKSYWAESLERLRKIVER